MKNKSKRIPPLFNVDIGFIDVAEHVDACESKELERNHHKQKGKQSVETRK